MELKKPAFLEAMLEENRKKNSDIDVVIEAPEGTGLEFVGVALELEKALGKKVDLLTYKGISPYLKEYILEEEAKII